MYRSSANSNKNCRRCVWFGTHGCEFLCIGRAVFGTDTNGSLNIIPILARSHLWGGSSSRLWNCNSASNFRNYACTSVRPNHKHYLLFIQVIYNSKFYRPFPIPANPNDNVNEYIYKNMSSLNAPLVRIQLSATTTRFQCPKLWVQCTPCSSLASAYPGISTSL